MVAPSIPPSSLTPPPPAAPPPRRSGLVWLTAGGGLLLGIVVAVAVLLLHRGSARGGPAARAVVRVVLESQSGTGFFVAGPDSFAYVVTANHVVDSGEPILVERTVDGPGGKHWVEAYPDAEVVAFDADADLAVIRLSGVSADQFASLPLAKEPAADEPILSYGFPASSLASRSGMVSKPGKILSLVRFPVVDRRTGEVIRNDAVDGLLVSSEIEPGFSGGPTLNERGEVVGVNVTKDTVHRAQNGAVSVAAVRSLIARVLPPSRQTDPTTDDVHALLTRIQDEYLLLPVERRWSAREGDFVSTGDLPRLGELITAIHRLENDTQRDGKTKLSGQATLGLVLARLPGRPLGTYTDPSTRAALAECEVRERKLQEFFGGLSRPGAGDADALAEAGKGRCSALAFRPLAWDMTALALRWEGKSRGVSISKVESVDPQKHVYRASARFDGIDYVVDVWLATDGGRLRLKLFDNDGRPAGLSLVQTTPASAFTGTWHRSEPRTAKDFGHGVDADTDTDETLVVALATDGTATITHQLRRHVYFTGRRRAACGGAKLDLGLEQTFSGSLRDASIVGFRKMDAKGIGADMARCYTMFTYAPDQVTVLKRVGERLIMVRTDGVAFPEAAEFER
ncbi:MAG TPA: serine protease, partial [Polyangiaceae bacterium]|jgi:S1-C subfamily serine protease